MSDRTVSLHSRSTIPKLFTLHDSDCCQVSIRPETDPRSLSSMLGVAIRIAQRMGIHNEASNATCAALEAEMRRRLWWSLVIFDNRICEMFDYRKATLAPTWDCHVPLNLSDFEVSEIQKFMHRKTLKLYLWSLPNSS